MNGLGSKVPAQPEKTTGATGENNRSHRNLDESSAPTGENHRSNRRKPPDPSDKTTGGYGTPYFTRFRSNRRKPPEPPELGVKVPNPPEKTTGATGTLACGGINKINKMCFSF